MMMQACGGATGAPDASAWRAMSPLPRIGARALGHEARPAVALPLGRDALARGVP